jgi:hypothetical protein
VLKRLRSVGQTVILTDGDVVFQPRKVEHAGLAKVADGDVLIYIHKEEAWTTSSGAFRPSTTSSWTTSCASWTRSSRSGESA